MTQAVINSLNYANNGLSNETPVKTSYCETETDNANEFDKILDSETDKVSLTIGDMKNNISEGTKSVLSDLKEILNETTDEVSMENALDLTLCRDIEDILGQIRGFNTKSENNDETAEANEEKITVANSTLLIFDKLVNLQNNKTADNIDINNYIYNEEPEIQNTEIQEAEETFVKTNTEKDVVSDTESSISDEMLNELKIEAVSTDTSASNDSFTDNGSAFEEHSLKVTLNHDIAKFELNVNKTEQTATLSPKEITAEKIIEQITKQMDSMNGSQKVNIVLNPESLGKVNIQLMNTKEGLAAQFTVSSNEIRELLIKGLDGLKETLLAQGIGVDNISVKISEPEEAYNPDWTEQEGSNGGNKEHPQKNREEKEKGLFEKTFAENFEKENGNV